MSVFAALSELSALFPGKPVFALDIAGAPLRVLGFSGHEALCELFEFPSRSSAQTSIPTT